ncbi:MAG: ABC transporter permease, partial [Planctomycetota bacterium]|nr:ABC transporter permease [Planctomycetota bacterium]
MNAFTLILRGLWHFRRTHAGVVLGTAVGTAVLVGALVTGDSVRASLREQAMNRIGAVHSVLASHDRSFGGDLGERLGAEIPDLRFAPIIHLGGVAARADGSFRANDVSVLGIDKRFFRMAPVRTELERLETGEAYFNEYLARRLDVDVGDTVVLRVESPGTLPRDLVLATIDDAEVALRVAVKGILTEEQFGRFGLAASQLPPLNVYLDGGWLGSQLGFGNNLLLVDCDAAAAGAALREAFILRDAGIREMAFADRDDVALRTRRVFLDTHVADAAAGLGLPLNRILTYFVNTLASGQRSTPYSTVAAVEWWDMDDDEIVVNEWLAEDLDAGPGEELTLTYFVPGPRRELLERSRTFRIREVVPLEGRVADPTLMPDYPGLSDAEHCRDWEPGVKIDLGHIREKDETYWDAHRGTPKAFVTLAAGQAMWSNPFGSLTEIRAPENARDELLTGLRNAIDPAAIGLSFQD